MSSLQQLPPGRAGRLWLRERIQVAERASELLDTKRRLLQEEVQRLERRRSATADAWAAARAQARTGALRAATLGGSRCLRLASPPPQASVTVAQATFVGISYPGTVICAPPDISAQNAPPPAPAVSRAAEAYRRALRVGAEHAVAVAALDTVAAELARTRQRLRAVRDRGLPRLKDRLTSIERALDEQERADIARMRWAVTHQRAGFGSAPTPTSR
ncbi:MAG: V-type ATP synthase subunit D [Frankiaceae bacterium]